MPAYVFCKVDNQHYLVKSKSEKLYCYHSQEEIKLHDTVLVIRDYRKRGRETRIYLPKYQKKVMIYKCHHERCLCKVTETMPGKPRPWHEMVHYDPEGNENV